VFSKKFIGDNFVSWSEKKESIILLARVEEFGFFSLVLGASSIGGRAFFHCSWIIPHPIRVCLLWVVLLICGTSFPHCWAYLSCWEHSCSWASWLGVGGRFSLVRIWGLVVDKSLYLEGRTTSVAEFITCWTSFPVLEEAFDLGAEFIYRLAACSPICCVELKGRLLLWGDFFRLLFVA
jgi:hypothetical protein